MYMYQYMCKDVKNSLFLSLCLFLSLSLFLSLCEYFIVLKIYRASNLHSNNDLWPS